MIIVRNALKKIKSVRIVANKKLHNRLYNNMIALVCYKNIKYIANIMVKKLILSAVFWITIGLFMMCNILFWNLNFLPGMNQDTL